MDLNKDNQLKFQEGSTTEPLTILNANVTELEFGPKYVVSIQPTIEGYDHFLPSPGLEKKMKDENIDVGDKITIEKIAKSEKYPYGYFSVNVVEKGNGPQIAKDRVNKKEPTHKSIEKFEQQFNEPKKEDKIGLHELTLRVDKLEKMVTILSSEAGHKPGDEKIPF